MGFGLYVALANAVERAASMTTKMLKTIKGIRSHEDDSRDIRDILPSKTIHEDNSNVTAMGLVSRPLTEDQESTGGFFGDSSTIAFIKQLQDTVRLRTPGPEPMQEFSNYGSQESPTILNETVDSHELLPPRHLADHLVDRYFSKIHTLYPFIHKEAFLAAYESLWRQNDNPSTERSANGLGLGDTRGTRTSFYYGLNIVFAMGCQFSDIIQHEREAISEAFFHACKPALDVDYLEAGDLALTQTLLLMAHYLQGSRAPNRCWHVIGIACRLAQGIGLHSDAGNDHRSFAEIQVRRRVYHGCVMLDLAISIILGRPVIVPHKQCTPLPLPIDDRFLMVDSLVCEQPPGLFSRVEWFIATLKLYELVRKTLNTLYDNVGKDCEDELADQRQNKRLFQIQSITQIDSELQEFQLRIPGPLRWDVPVPEAQQYGFLREKYLLKASRLPSSNLM
ncbi:hypothetical protein N7448_006085 [Penicillium atrosanguineum]|nr:hypothetical protein N7448_006085 [Penicillium atrosanguineum]KAJ5137863.1 hypothetical protein N7526_004096 [Penicillium atrosanguineum]